MRWGRKQLPAVIEAMREDRGAPHGTHPIVDDEWDAMRSVYDILVAFTQPERQRILDAVYRRLGDSPAPFEYDGNE